MPYLLAKLEGRPAKLLPILSSPAGVPSAIRPVFIGSPLTNYAAAPEAVPFVVQLN